MRALEIEVYRTARHTDCTNNGISSRYGKLLLVHPQGNIEFDIENPPENLVKLVRRRLFGRECLHIEPVAQPDGVGWMYGGNIASSSDGRFYDLSPYPLHIHDRQETQEQYDMMNN